MSERVPSLLDYSSFCPTYAQIIARHRESFVTTQEVSKLQGELEELKRDAEARLNWLKSESEGIDSDKVSTSDSDVASMSPRQQSSLFKRGPGRPSSERNKNIKNNMSNRLLKNKVKKVEADHAGPVVTDAPYKFWQTINSWCGDITTDDIEKLTELIKSNTPDDACFKVPALGVHYSQQWAAQDLLSEQTEGTEPHCRNSEISNITSSNVFKPDRKPGNVGPLTERLLNALIEERVLESDPITDMSLYRDIPSPKTSGTASSDNAAYVEKRIREELVDLGVLNESDNESEDEVLAELTAKQQELRELTEYNATQLQLLKDTATEYMKQQEIRHRIDTIDDEVCDTYRNFMLKKHKKIPYTKKEKEQATRLLNEREYLNKQLQESSFLSMT